VTETLTTWAEAVGLLAIAVGLGWITADRFGIGWGLLAFGAVILCMSAGVAALARRKGGTQ
jgi:uncharacterized membrane protein YhfC